MRVALSKKGMSLADMRTAAMTLILVGIVLGMGVWINQDIYKTGFSTELVVNHSMTLTANTFNQLPHRTSSISSISNATDLLTAANWSTLRDIGYVSEFNFTNGTAGAIFTGTWNVSYNAYNSTEFYAVMNSTSGISKLGQWLPIVMVVIAAAVVIGVLIMAFGSRGGI